jgi:hypothetical protein
MHDSPQSSIPRSFIELFVPRGAHKPRQSWAVLATRYELCEDMAQMLVDQAQTKAFELGADEHEVLLRIHRGLLADGSVLAAREADWVVCRLAELTGWPWPAWLTDLRPAARPG